MRTDCFSEAAVRAAYEMAAQKWSADVEEFTEKSSFFEFAVTNLPGLTIDVECDTTLPLSTPAERRQLALQKRIARSQAKALRLEQRQQRKREREAARRSRELRRQQRD